jgi:hypothetical protein
MMNPLPLSERPLDNKQLRLLEKDIDSSPIPFTSDLMESLDHVEVAMKIGNTTLVLPISFSAGLAIASQDNTFINALFRYNGEWGCVVHGDFRLEVNGDSDNGMSEESDA